MAALGVTTLTVTLSAMVAVNALIMGKCRGIGHGIYNCINENHIDYVCDWLTLG